MFNVHIQNKLVLHTPVTGTGDSLRRYLCPGQEKKRRREEGGGGEITCTGGYKGVQAVHLGSVAGGGCYGIWNVL